MTHATRYGETFQPREGPQLIVNLHTLPPVAAALFLSLSCKTVEPNEPPSAPAHEQPDAETPLSVRQLTAWLDAYNAGERQRYEQFLTTNFPERLPHLDDIMYFRGLTGGFELRKIEQASATEVTALLQERDSDQFVRVQLVVQDAEPHAIASLDIEVIPRPAEFPIERLGEDQLVANLKALLDERVAADRFAGAVIVAKHGEILFSDARGLADRANHSPNTLDTRFRIGSMNKMFTAVAVLQLVEAGKLELDAPLGKYLTKYPNREVAEKVTLHHLLTHTGGTGDIFGPDFATNITKLRSHDDYVALYGQRGLEFEPGSKWAYSNYGMLLLGVVIEKVSKQSYYDYVQDHIYKPAGMTESGSLPEDQAVPNRSIGYMKPPGTAEWIVNTDTLPYRGTAAGGGYSTVRDLERFARALLGHELLSPESTKLVLSAKVEGYAYGFMDARDAEGNGWVGHGGGAPGMNGDLRIYPKSGYVVAVLSNLDPPSAQRISGYIDLRLPQE
jgi:D-alanyl-D-alanine carboxypeptidase